ncbi:MAG: hypothetical protein IJP28_00780 [Erysipelotrichales bacterium]|nr:hypothetical protein [Erysipelotrichales bacterium]
MDDRCVQCGKFYPSVLGLFVRSVPFCQHCLQKAYEEIHVSEYKGCTLYYLHTYNEENMGQLISLKGNGEKWYKDLLIHPKIRQALHKRFKDHTFVYMPSHREDDEERGFKHLPVLFENITRNEVYPLYKKVRYKQSKYTKQDRVRVRERLGVDEELKNTLRNKKVVLVDDVMSSGATLEAARELLELVDVELLVCLYNEEKRGVEL